MAQNQRCTLPLCGPSQRTAGGELSLEILPSFCASTSPKPLKNKHPYVAGPKTIPNFFMQNRTSRATHEIANLRGPVTCVSKGAFHVRQNSNQGESRRANSRRGALRLQRASQAIFSGRSARLKKNQASPGHRCCCKTFPPSTISTNRDAHAPATATIVPWESR